MANEQNLKPIKSGELSKEEAKRRGSNGGKKSGEKRRELKKIKEYLEIGLGLAISDKQGNTYSRKEAGVLKLIERYVKGDPKAFDTVVELLGEKPAAKQEILNKNGIIIQVADDRHKQMMNELQNANFN